MSADYFAQPDVVSAMRHDHVYLWMEMLAAVRRQLPPSARVADLGCSSGELLRILFYGIPGLLEPLHPSLGIGIDLPEMSAVLAEAACRTARELPITFCHAPLTAFPAQFDLILSHEVLYLIEDLDGIAVAALEALRPGGIFCAATMGYSENEYYRRWLPLMRARQIRAFDRSSETYKQALRQAGFADVQMQSLLLTAETYEAWRARQACDDDEWFTSHEDERRYFTQVGKLLLIGQRGDD
jgi:SAM-dependent methyltransferase